MSSDESWLVTGINGCIGAWVGLTLAKENKRVWSDLIEATRSIACV